MLRTDLNNSERKVEGRTSRDGGTGEGADVSSDERKMWKRVLTSPDSEISCKAGMDHSQLHAPQVVDRL